MGQVIRIDKKIILSRREKYKHTLAKQALTGNVGARAELGAVLLRDCIMEGYIRWPLSWCDDLTASIRKLRRLAEPPRSARA